MKKLIITVLLSVTVSTFFISCRDIDLDEEQELLSIDKEEVESPDDRD